ncbi:MAG: transcriptional repressor [Chloroflexi bacterium]|nr:transcriptional repressor [Chloroflexota bacterium]
MAKSKTARTALTGQRLTAQRRLLFDLLRKGKGHPDVDELYRQAKQLDPRISLSTVYRNLRLFKKLGLVEELHLEEEHHHYESRPTTEHYHLVCRGCGQVVEFRSPHVDKLKQEVGQEHRYAILGADVSLVGYCPRCQANRQKV